MSNQYIVLSFWGNERRKTHTNISHLSKCNTSRKIIFQLYPRHCDQYFRAQRCVLTKYNPVDIWVSSLFNYNDNNINVNTRIYYLVFGFQSLADQTKKTTTKGWSPNFATGLSVIIAIDQKIYEWQDCSFARIVYSKAGHFGKMTAWLLLYFLNYAYYDI